MIVYPNAKINLGLNVISKRSDGFHNIETVFYPVKWCDALEVIENKEAGAKKITFSFSGISVDGAPENNLAAKAYHALGRKHELPPVKVHLHKEIPMGAGLGGGSSDAAYMLKALNIIFDLRLADEALQDIASELGSDCAFFIKNFPVKATERGNVFSPLATDLKKYNSVIVWPGIHSNTADAYGGIRPAPSDQPCAEIVNLAIHEWKEKLRNDFESTIFLKYPEIKSVKEQLYKAGALYASMSGSGSAVFGIFDQDIPKMNWPAHYKHFIQYKA